MKRTHIDDIKAEGETLSEQELRRVLGGMRNSRSRSSKVIDLQSGYTAADQDF